MEQLENIVLSGGGIKGYLHLGVLKALERYNLLSSIKRFCGTSIGAFVCFLYILELSPSQIEELFLTMDLHYFLQLIPEQIFAVLETFGVNDGQQLENILCIILEKTGFSKTITFKELYDATQKDLIVTGTCLDTYKTVYFSRKSTPTMEVKLAIRISMCLPFLFQPIVYNDKRYVDGGVSNNFPLEIFQNQKHKTLGVILHGKSKDKDYTIPKHIIEYGMSLFRCMSSCFDDYKKTTWKDKVLALYTTVETIDLDTSIENRIQMIKEAEDNTTFYIEEKLKKETLQFVNQYVLSIMKSVKQQLLD